METQCIEYWKTVPGFCHLQVTISGKVRVTERWVANRWKPRLAAEQILKTSPTSNGYLRVKHDRKSRLVHRLVALTFCRGWSPELQVNHKNGDKRDNRAVNLEWVTGKENVQHSAQNGLHPIGERNSKAKLTQSDVLSIRDLWNNGQTTREIAKKYPVTQSAVYKIVTRKLWRHV